MLPFVYQDGTLHVALSESNGHFLSSVTASESQLAHALAHSRVPSNHSLPWSGQEGQGTQHTVHSTSSAKRLMQLILCTQLVYPVMYPCEQHHVVTIDHDGTHLAHPPLAQRPRPRCPAALEAERAPSAGPQRWARSPCHTAASHLHPLHACR